MLRAPRLAEGDVRPSPWPCPRSAAAVWKRRGPCVSRSSGKPGPWSRTVIRVPVTVPWTGAPPWRWALVTRLPRIRSTRRGPVRTVRGAPVSSMCTSVLVPPRRTTSVTSSPRGTDTGVQVAFGDLAGGAGAVAQSAVHRLGGEGGEGDDHGQGREDGLDDAAVEELEAASAERRSTASTSRTAALRPVHGNSVCSRLPGLPYPFGTWACRAMTSAQRTATVAISRPRRQVPCRQVPGCPVRRRDVWCRHVLRPQVSLPLSHPLPVRVGVLMPSRPVRRGQPVTRARRAASAGGRPGAARCPPGPPGRPPRSATGPRAGPGRRRRQAHHM